MRFNVNEHVRVRVTPHGRRLLAEKQRKLEAEFRVSLDRLYPADDGDGWSRWQLWKLMAAFGEHLTNGGPVPFEMVIEIPEPEDRT